MKARVLLIFIFFSGMVVAEHGVGDHHLRKGIKILVKFFLFSIIVFTMMKPLAELQVKAGKTITK